MSEGFAVVSIAETYGTITVQCRRSKKKKRRSSLSRTGKKSEKKVLTFSFSSLCEGQLSNLRKHRKRSNRGEKKKKAGKGEGISWTRHIDMLPESGVRATLILESHTTVSISFFFSSLSSHCRKPHKREEKKKRSSKHDGSSSSVESEFASEACIRRDSIKTSNLLFHRQAS